MSAFAQKIGLKPLIIQLCFCKTFDDFIGQNEATEYFWKHLPTTNCFSLEAIKEKNVFLMSSEPYLHCISFNCTLVHSNNSEKKLDYLFFQG